MIKCNAVHLTSAHPRYDTRIFYKECMSLSKEGYDVTLVVADGKGDELSHGISIVDVGAIKGRFKRVINSPRKVYLQALELNADIYHLHDPELIPIGLRLQRKGYKVIFDAHEDFPKQLANKSYLPKYVRLPLSWVAKLYENHALKCFSAVVAATPSIKNKFLSTNINTIDVNNFPRYSFINKTKDNDFTDRANACYIGGITEARGIWESLNALEYTDNDCNLSLAGKFFSAELESQAKNHLMWSKVDFYGLLDHSEVNRVLDSAFVGLVTLHPISNYLDSLPVKMFEYMANGLPVIYSNIEYWKELIGNEECGISVDPHNPKEIAKAITFFKNNKERAKEMGENGRRLVLEKFNWGVEEQKLYGLYNSLMQL